MNSTKTMLAALAATFLLVPAAVASTLPKAHIEITAVPEGIGPCIKKES